MRLYLPTLSFNEKLDEFDYWITPSLGDIRKSNRYNEVQRHVSSLIEIVGKTTNNFERFESFSSKTIALSIVNHIKNLDNYEKITITNALSSFLFLVTGKSDNNCKCQFPLFLRDVVRTNTFPKVSTIKGRNILTEIQIPREIKSDRIAKLISDLCNHHHKQIEVLSQYVSFIIDGEQYLRSFWSIGKTYFEMKKLGFEKDFLQPLIIFQVRGSVSASGGHEPEDSLRDRMVEWGLRPNIDFNSSDIIITKNSLVVDEVLELPISENDTTEEIVEKAQEVIKNKTRAYDFVLPYDVKGWDQKIFVQCQFYAGDSGSVSHKNVDQTRTSREYVKTKRVDPIFLEYIDGAGYFSSLWGDLKKIISMPDTKDFFQVRTAVIKLRSHLQLVGFLTPLEVIHAWALKEGNLSEIVNHLIQEEYSETEIIRVLENDIFTKDSNVLVVNPSYIEMSRRYLLLDFIATKGYLFDEITRITGALLIPAFGKYFGIKIADISEAIIPQSGKFKETWANSAHILKDIQFLCDNGWVVQR